MYVFPSKRMTLRGWYYYMDTYSYTRVGMEGVAVLRQLREVFVCAFEENELSDTKQPSDKCLRKVLKDTYYITLVPKDLNRNVAGGLIAHILSKIDQERSDVYLYDLAVALEHRRHGIATKLISELKTIAKEYGAYVIFVQADNVDEEAVALYTKLSTSVESDISHFDIDVS